jgi:hypothetical protein
MLDLNKSVIDPNPDHDYRGEDDVQKIISMLEEMVIKPGYDASIGPGAGDSAWGDIRIPAKHVKGFVEFLRTRQQAQAPCGSDCKGECSGEVTGIPHCPHTPAPERYTGVCAVQENCIDYSDFIESIEDELSEDDDPVCPIKCAKRVNPQQEALADSARTTTLAAIKPFEDYARTLNEIESCVIRGKLLDIVESLKGNLKQEVKK